MQTLSCEFVQKWSLCKWWCAGGWTSLQWCDVWRSMYSSCQVWCTWTKILLDGQCTACPAKLYKDSHCSEGGEIVEEKACGPVNAHCEAKCRLPQSSPAPKPKLYWDGQCTACPAHLYSHCSNGGTLVGEKGCGLLKVFCEGILPHSRVGRSILGHLNNFFWTESCNHLSRDML